jgi:nucleoside 2-deoxyribosyltransferase
LIKLFVAIPKNEDAERLWHNVIRVAFQCPSIYLYRITENLNQHKVWPFIFQTIDDCTAVVAVVNTPNTNVCLELGFALGRKKNTVILGREEDRALYANWSIFVSTGQCEQCMIHELRLNIKNIDPYIDI